MKTWILASALVVSAGALTALPSCTASQATSASAKSEKIADADEVKVKMEECPKPVQDTLKKELAGGKLEDISRESEHGKVIYEADAEINGKDYEIQVAADGTLISKKIEDDKDEKKEADEKEVKKSGKESSKEVAEKDEKSEKGEKAEDGEKSSKGKKAEKDDDDDEEDDD